MKKQLCFKCATMRFGNEHLKRCGGGIVEIPERKQWDRQEKEYPDLRYKEYTVEYRKLMGSSNEVYEMDVTDICKVFEWDDCILKGDGNSGVFYSYRKNGRLYVGYDRKRTLDERFQMLDPNQTFLYRYVRKECTYGLSHQVKWKRTVTMVLYVFRFKQIQS